MKKLLAIIGLAWALCQPAFSQIQTESVDIWAPGYTTFSAPAVVTLTSSGNGTFNLAAPTPVTFTSQSGSTLTINLTELEVDSDPHIQFAFGVDNPEGATGYSNYTFTFSNAATNNLNLTPGQYNVSSSIGVTLTSGEDDPSTPVTLEPTGTNGYVSQAYFGVGPGKQDAGVDILNSNLSFTPSQLPPVPSYTDTFAQVQSPTLGYNLTSTQSQISVTTSFQLSNSDSASVSGRFDVNPIDQTSSTVPEPSTNALLLAGLGTLLLVVRRRWRSH